MQRGRRLFDQLVYDEKIVKKAKRGRDLELVERRNKMLFYRYYYYSKIHKLTYVDVLDKIETEFYLSGRTISDLLQVNSGALKQIFSEKPDLKYLNKEYSFFNWINKNVK